MAPSVSMAEGFALCCLAFRNLRSVRFQDILWEKHMGVSENGAYTFFYHAEAAISTCHVMVFENRWSAKLRVQANRMLHGHIFRSASLSDGLCKRKLMEDFPHPPSHQIDLVCNLFIFGSHLFIK
eukprot:s2454_g5.t1